MNINGYDNGLVQGMGWMLDYILKQLPLDNKERKRVRNRGIQELLKTKGYSETTSEEMIIKYLGME